MSRGVKRDLIAVGVIIAVVALAAVVGYWWMVSTGRWRHSNPESLPACPDAVVALSLTIGDDGTPEEKPWYNSWCLNEAGYPVFYDVARSGDCLVGITVKVFDLPGPRETHEIGHCIAQVL